MTAQMQTINKFTLKISVSVSILKDSVARLFVAASVQQRVVQKPWPREPVRMNEGASLRLIVCLPNQCFFLQGLES